MDINQIHRNLLNDARIELTEEFDRNFERKAFFDQRWPTVKLINRRGSVMARSNNLRRGYRSRLDGEKIAFSNSLPYASIHNEGGEITVTQKMKKYFWAMYYRAGGKNNNNIEAQQWKALALMKIGKKVKIPSRRVIGDHPRIKEVIESVVSDNLGDLNNFIVQQLRQR